MRRAFLSSALLVGGLLAAACTEQRSPLPSESPPFDVTSSGTCTADDINAQISALFPAGDGLTDARQQFRTIQKQKSKGDLAGARSSTFTMVAFTLRKYYQGKLLDPNGPSDPTTAQAVVTLIDALFCFVGLPPSGLDAAHLGMPGTNTAVAVIGSSGGGLLGADNLAALSVPAGAVSGDHVFAITRRDDLARAGTCLITTLRQIPLCDDFTVVPVTRFAVNVTVVVCQLEAGSPYPGRLRLAHPDPDVPGTIQILPRVSDPFGLVCTNAALASTGGLGGLIKRLGSFAARLISPTPLYAGHSGLGGLTCCFSDFTAIDPVIKVSGFTSPRDRAPLLDPDGNATAGDLGSSNIVTDLRDPAKFGPEGVVRCEVEPSPFVTSVATGSLVDPDGRPRVSVFFAGLTATTLTDEEAAELAGFVKAGGILYVSGNTAPNEGPSYNPLFTALAVGDRYNTEIVTTGNFVQSSDPPDNTPFTNGPFGAVGPLMHTPFRIIEPVATTGLATGFNSSAFILAEGALGSGRLSMTGDPLYFNFFTGTSDPDNQKYFLNLFAFGCR